MLVGLIVIKLWLFSDKTYHKKVLKTRICGTTNRQPKIERDNTNYKVQFVYAGAVVNGP